MHILSRYPEGTSTRTIYTFLNAWMKRDWWACAYTTQLSWRRHYQTWQLPLAVRILFGELDLRSDNEIVSVREISDVLHEITIRVTLRSRLRDVTPLGDRMQRSGPWETLELRVNVIREVAPLEPSSEGEWGVNPSSVFRRVPERSTDVQTSEEGIDEEGIDTIDDRRVDGPPTLRDS